MIGKGHQAGTSFEVYKLHLWFTPQASCSRTFPGRSSADSVAYKVPTCLWGRWNGVAAATSSLHSSLFHLHKQPQSDPFQGNHCPYHLCESQRGKWSPTWVRWGYTVLKDSTDKWEASKVSLEPSPFSFPFSPSSVFLSLAWLKSVFREGPEVSYLTGNEVRKYRCGFCALLRAFRNQWASQGGRFVLFRINDSVPRIVPGSLNFVG